MTKSLAIIMVVVLVLAGGGIWVWAAHKSKTNTSASANTSRAMPSSSSTNSSATATDKVTIASFAFSPAKITVKKGTTVTWTNQDSTEHTVTSDTGTELKSDSLAKGATYAHVFNTPGSYSYHCSFHSEMTGTVIVTE